MSSLSILQGARRRSRTEHEGTAVILPVEMKKKSVKALYWSIFLFFILLSLIFFVPIMWMLLSAFKDTQEFFEVPPSFLPKQFSLQKIADVWKMTAIGSTYFNTLVMVAGELIFLLVCNGLAGYVISRLKPKGYKLIFTLVLWTMMMPTNLSMVPRYLSFINIPVLHVSLADTYWPMWMMAGANAFDTMLFKNFFDKIPSSYIEAAKIDGCSEGGIFLRVILPLSKPIMMTVTIFGVTTGWGSFLWPYLMIKDTAIQPIGVKVFLLQTALSADNYMMMLIFVILPPIILFFFLQKYIMQGVSGGGVKG